ncbi:MAG: hypothetical protein H7257_08605, partial [Taibaiella sp.]|nr:hypothetical protein [Taibaiella sp.]
MRIILSLIFVIISVARGNGQTSGIITTVAGDGSYDAPAAVTDGVAATTVPISCPRDITVTANGVIYIADFLHNRVRKVSSSGVISTVAGGGSSSYYSGANATYISLPSSPHYIDVDTANNIYFTAGFFVLKVTAGGIITTVAGDFS